MVTIGLKRLVVLSVLLSLGGALSQPKLADGISETLVTAQELESVDQLWYGGEVNVYAR